MSATALDMMEHQVHAGYFAGTAVTLSPRREKPRVSVPGSPSGFDGLASKLLSWTDYGVSDSAVDLQLFMSLITPDFEHWRLTTEEENLDVEKEIIVLLPPKNPTKVVVKVHHVGPARPLIVAEDIR